MAPLSLKTSLLILIPLCLSITSIFYPPVLGVDFSSHVLAFDAFQDGALWNHTFALNPDNIAQDKQAFLSWWTPGPSHLLWLLSLGGLSLGTSISVSLFVLSICGLAGYHHLYKELEISDKISYWSLLYIVCSWHFLYTFRRFQGGELLLFAVLPWMMLFICRVSSHRISDYPKILIWILIGAFAKLSALIAGLATLLGNAIIPFSDEKFLSQRRFILISKALLTFLLTYGIVYYLFARHGATPSNLNCTPMEPMQGVLLAIGLPLHSIFALGSIFGRIYPGWSSNYLFLTCSSLVSILIYIALIKNSALIKYRAYLISFLAIYISIHSYFFLCGACVSPEDRLFRPIAFLILPGLLTWVRKIHLPLLRAGAIFLLVLSASYGVASYVYRINIIQSSSSQSSRGFSYSNIPQEVVDNLNHIDKTLPAGNNLFYIGDKQLVHEIQSHRAHSFQTKSVISSATKLHGKVDRLIVVIPAHSSDKKTHDVILSSFVNYERGSWKLSKRAGWSFYSQNAQ